MADALDEDLKQIARGKVNTVMPVMGLAVGLVPFALSFRSTHQSTVRTGEGDGMVIESVTRKTAFDYVAVPCGAVAFVLGLVGLVRGFRVRKYEVMVFGVVAMGLGLYQGVRGFLFLP